MLSTLFVQTGPGSEGLRNLPPASRTLPSLLPKLNLLLSPQQTCNGNFFQSTSQDPQIRLGTKTIKSDGLKDHKAQASERPSIRGPPSGEQKAACVSPTSASRHHPAGGTFADATSARPSHRPREPAGGDKLKGAGARSASPPSIQIRYFSVM